MCVRVCFFASECARARACLRAGATSGPDSETWSLHSVFLLSLGWVFIYLFLIYFFQACISQVQLGRSRGFAHCGWKVTSLVDPELGFSEGYWMQTLFWHDLGLNSCDVGKGSEGVKRSSVGWDTYDIFIWFFYAIITFVSCVLCMISINVLSSTEMLRYEKRTK